MRGVCMHAPCCAAVHSRTVIAHCPPPPCCSVEKVFEIDKHIATAVSGLISDARTLIEHARVEAQNHRFSYNEPIRVESLTQSICDLALSFGEGGEENKSKMSRPFGVSLLIAGADERGPQLFHTDPSGTYTAYEAHAIGNGSEGARTLLQEKYHKSMSLADAAALVVRILSDTMEEKVTPTNVELAAVTPAGGYRMYAPDEVAALIARAQAEAAAETA